MMRRMESGRYFFNPSSHADVLFLGKADHDPPFRGASWSESLKRRPCLFSCPESVFDDEYYDEQSSDKKRRLTSQQVHLLEKSFEEENKLEPERKMELANNLGLQPRQVAVWFQNRRARWKAKQLERDYDQLKSSHNYLLSHYNSLLKENEKLKAEVDLLTKKLQGNYKEVGNGESDGIQVVSVKVNEGSPKQLLDLDYYFHTDEDMDHASNCLPLAHTTTDEPLGWFWS